MKREVETKLKAKRQDLENLKKKNEQAQAELAAAEETHRKEAAKAEGSKEVPTAALDELRAKFQKAKADLANKEAEVQAIDKRIKVSPCV